MSFNRPEQSLRMSEPALYGRSADFYDHLKEETTPLKPASFGEFVNVYPAEEIHRDQEAIRRNQGKFETYSGEWSELTTKLLVEGVYNHDWLATDDPDWETHVEVANRFDDVQRGVDLIIVFHNRVTKAEMLLMLDTTTSEQAISNKQAKIDRDIEQGHLRKIKYYKSPKTGKAIGRREGIAGIVHYSREKLTEISDHFKTAGDTIWNDPELNLETLLRHELIDQIDEQIDTAYDTQDEDTANRLAGRLTRMRTLLEVDTQEKRATA